MNLGIYKLFIATIIATFGVIAVKYVFHTLGLEVLEASSLHSSAISGVVFVLGFILSSTISDYKEAERIPAEIAATIEDMNEDVMSIARNYKKFAVSRYQKQLISVAQAFAGDLRNSKSHRAKTELYKLDDMHADMEKAGVPANFIVKLKTQQAGLVRHLFRVNYIQRITFIPSATLLAWSIVVLTMLLLFVTEIEPFAGGMVLTGVIAFIMIYVLQLIAVIRTPFHDDGKTRDDVSLFLIDRTISYISDRIVSAKKK